MAELIKADDSLNDGRKKLNEAIKDSNKAKQDASEALNTANTSINQSTSTQDQLDNIIINSGTSDAEVIQARTDEKGATHATLKKRIDDSVSDITTQLAQTEQDEFKDSLVKHTSNRLLAVWQDDDGRAGIYTKLAPVARQYGIPISCAIYTNGEHGFPISGLPAHDPVYISYNQMKELEEEGIAEFLSHTHNHKYLDSATDEEIHYELKTSKEILRKLGWNYKDFVLPGGRHDANIRYIVSQYYENAFKVGNILPDNHSPFGQYEIPRVTIPNEYDYSIDDKKAEIDKLLDRFGFVTFMTHADLGSGIDIDRFKILLDYVKSKGVEFVTTRELMREKGHLLELGDNTITSNGEIYGKDIGVYRNKDADLPLNAPIDSFDKGTVTRVRIHSSQYQQYNIPGGGSAPYGYAEVHRDSEQDIFSFQMFFDAPNNRVLKRRWISDDWSNWEEAGAYQHLFGVITDNAPISSYPKQKVTKQRVSMATSSVIGLPDIFGQRPFGFVETHRDVNQDTYSFQVFTDVRNKLTLSRRPSGDSWDEWMILGSPYLTINAPIPHNPKIDFFLPGTTTRFRVGQLYAENYNVPTGSNPTYGWIDTIRDVDQDVFSYQKFYDINNNISYVRRWTVSEDDWSNWE